MERLSQNFERLKAHILPMSKAEVFDAARREWDLVRVEVSEEFDSCPCGQEIKEHCYIRNSLTGHETYVGNVCINRFMGIDTGTLFDGLRRIQENLDANANADVIQYAQQRGFLFEGEYAFLTQTMRKRKLSERQLNWKRKINRRIVQGIAVRKRSAIA